MAHVPARQVLASAVAMWTCYFALITMRSVVVEMGGFGDLLWRRALVTLAGIAVTMLAWPLLRWFDGRATTVRMAAAAIIMAPAALALAVINQQAFATVDAQWMAQTSDQHDMPKTPAVKPHTPKTHKRVHIQRDMSGNMLVDVEEGDAAADARADAAEAAADAAAEARDAAADAKDAAAEAGQATAKPTIFIQNPVEHEGLWRQLTDVALGRYFLLIAWAALYLAMGNAERVRAAERREAGYRSAAKAAELRSLRYQVNPHFLFNTLNSLSALVMTGREHAAERMIQAMSSFYRHSLAADPSADVPLADEIALQRHYLEIEAVRFPDRLITTIDVPDALRGALVPGMILQPLVENSIKYAVAATTRAVTVRIVARGVGDRLVLTIADDGPGKTGSELGNGIGLENVRNRLAARFGQDAQIASGPLPAGGYETTLIVPLLMDFTYDRTPR